MTGRLEAWPSASTSQGALGARKRRGSWLPELMQRSYRRAPLAARFEDADLLVEARGDLFHRRDHAVVLFDRRVAQARRALLVVDDAVETGEVGIACRNELTNLPLRSHHLGFADAVGIRQRGN